MQSQADPSQVSASRRVLQRSQCEVKPYFVTVAREDFIVLPHVFSPKYFGSTDVFSELFPYRPGDRLLEVGCGAGITSILAAKQGASRVLAVDINPIAVENARLNTEIHGVSDVVETRLSDLYSAVRSDERFSTIYWNSNFIYVEPTYTYESVLEMALFDPGYKHLEAFVRGASRHLDAGGRVIVGFGDFGDQWRLAEFANRNEFEMREICRGPGDEEGPVSFILFELTRRG